MSRAAAPTIPLTPAAKALAEQYVPMVANVVKRVGDRLPRRADRDELTSFAYLGLIHAASRFDASRGYLFSTYARHCIRGANFDGLRATLGRYAGGQRLRCVNMAPLTAAAGHATNTAEIGSDLEARDEVRKLAQILSPDERKVLNARMRGVPVKQIGLQLGVTGTRVSQISGAIMRRLKENHHENRHVA